MLEITPELNHELISIPIKTSINIIFKDFFVSLHYSIPIFFREYPLFKPIKVKNKSDMVSP